MQTIIRKGNFDAAHRIFNHPGKCANLHGHTYLFELEFAFDQVQTSDTEAGYPIDFADIKASAMKYIDDVYDHALIYNPQDTDLRMFAHHTKLRSVDMSMFNGKYCNPSVENMAVQLFSELDYLMHVKGLRMYCVTLYETPNCFTRATAQSLPDKMVVNKERVDMWKLSQQAPKDLFHQH